MHLSCCACQVNLIVALPLLFIEGVDRGEKLSSFVIIHCEGESKGEGSSVVVHCEGKGRGKELSSSIIVHCEGEEEEEVRRRSPSLRTYHHHMAIDDKVRGELLLLSVVICCEGESKGEGLSIITHCGEKDRGKKLLLPVIVHCESKDEGEGKEKEKESVVENVSSLSIVRKRAGVRICHIHCMREDKDKDELLLLLCCCLL